MQWKVLSRQLNPSQVLLPERLSKLKTSSRNPGLATSTELSESLTLPSIRLQYPVSIPVPLALRQLRYLLTGVAKGRRTVINRPSLLLHLKNGNLATYRKPHPFLGTTLSPPVIPRSNVLSIARMRPPTPLVITSTILFPLVFAPPSTVPTLLLATNPVKDEEMLLLAT